MSFKGLTINTAPEAPAHVKADDDRTIWESVFGVDAVLDVGNKLKAALVGNNKLRILDGVLVTGGAIGRIPFGEYEEVTIENGTAGQRRNDLIVAEIQANTSVERMRITYIKGTPGTTAEDPSYMKGNIYEGATVRQFPLYRVKLNGVNVDTVYVLFQKVGNIKQLSEKADRVDPMNEKVAELNSNLTNTSASVNLLNSVITIRLSDADAKPYRNVTIPLNTLECSSVKNNCLIHQNGGIKIGTGVKKILVSGGLFATTENATQYLWCVIKKNNEEKQISLTSTTTQFSAVSLSPVVINVANGDFITLAKITNSNDTIRGALNTWLTVQVIE